MPNTRVEGMCGKLRQDLSFGGGEMLAQLTAFRDYWRIHVSNSLPLHPPSSSLQQVSRYSMCFYTQESEA